MSTVWLRMAAGSAAALCVACWFAPTRPPQSSPSAASAERAPRSARSASPGATASTGAATTERGAVAGAGGDDTEGARPAPTDADLDPATQITSAEVLEHIEVLASDAYQGREAGTEGERRARRYIVSVLEDHPALQPAGVDGTWLQPFDLKLHGEPAEAHNVLARLPGTDPELSQQVIVVGAHYDHVGFGRSNNSLDGAGEIHNGADDNASGSSALLDLATSLAGAGQAPRRTIEFHWYSGEELGLLGSRHWVDHPLVPLDRVVFMINMDMVGRMVARTLVVGGTGTSPGLSDLTRGFCDELGLRMIDDPPGTAPSDNTSFYTHGIPALFLFTGLHDDYHKASDDTFRINQEGAADIARLASRIALAIDARDERPDFTPAPGEAYMFRPALYTGAAFVDDAGGPLRVAVVVPGSPAADAGLRVGDVVVALDGEATPDAAALQRLLDARLLEAPPLRFEVRADGEGASAAGDAGGPTRVVVIRPEVK